MNKEIKQLIKKMKIKVKNGNRCSAEPHNNAIILSKEASDYDVLHEISHLICGWGCCREHCEWEAHGGAKVLYDLFKIDKKQIDDAEERMNCYAHRTNPEACGRYSKENSWVKEIKKEERKKIFNFEEFLIGNKSGRMIVNPYWLEHLLNLFFQGYLGEVWEEIMDTEMNNCALIENWGYGIIKQELNKKHLDLSNSIAPRSNSPTASAKAEDLICVKEEFQK